MPFADVFDFRHAEGSLNQAGTEPNDGLDGLLGPLVDTTPLGQLVSTGNDEQPPSTSEPDNAGIFDPTRFAFDLLCQAGTPTLEPLTQPGDGLR